MKFIHSADWQLGKPYRYFEPEVRAGLSEARFEAIDTLGRTAVEHGAQHVVVAGDIFDTEGPEDRTIVQAISRMSRHSCRWWLLPGNHDFARNGGLWDRVRQRASENIAILSKPEPIEMNPGVWLLPAPLEHRHNLEDPTARFDAMETPGATLRIGLAHGSIRDFGSQGETRNQIAPDRARRSNLDYLALGDWHGALRVDGRTWYAGTPEVDRFQRDDPGQALVVELSTGVEPSVTPIRTGRFQWLLRDWMVSDRAAFDAECDLLLGAIDAPTTLLRLTLAGITSLGDRIDMLGRLENDLSHQLRYLDVRADDLVGRPSEEDIANLAVEGMLGAAAAMLNTRIESGGEDAAVAKRALERLFVEYNREESA
ncbi:DNA repair exonuclease [Stenotrophomonas geniculata]|uniref:metallophosphoesterase family protein n=1 Tax=Stenotrophomonas geniculata TaxID=86188 RepID=UPI001F5313FB|nr:DNA repair exonuclease [Stenotrophomonas geniculata]MCI1119686.1 DNA repair exonuclease [Stenotrophomonas maltophilia]WNF12565.1 DNA repair exonuclease [Stenotrophomonas geniculata]